MERPYKKDFSLFPIPYSLFPIPYSLFPPSYLCIISGEPKIKAA